MADKIQLEVVTPERRLIQAEVSEMNARAFLGEFGVLPGHANYIALLQPGELSYVLDGKRHHLAVAGGFVEVTLEEGIRVIADAAEFADEIDVERARQAKERAEKQLKELDPAHHPDDLARAEAALKRALIRLQVAEKVSPAGDME